MGVEVGYGGTKLEVTEANNGEESIYTTAQNKQGGGINYGITAGYKHFFNNYLGLRAYANFNALHSEISANEIIFKSNLFNYGVNLDFLGNFLSTEMIDFGGFVGVGLGASSLTGKDIDDLRNLMKETTDALQQLGNDGVKASYPKASFDVALNVGLRTNLYKNHGIELVARVPFLAPTIFEVSGVVADGQNTDTKATLKHTWNLNVRYTYSF